MNQLDKAYLDRDDGLIIQTAIFSLAMARVEATLHGIVRPTDAVEYVMPGAIPTAVLDKYQFISAHPEQLSVIHNPIKSGDNDYALNPAACYHCYPLVSHEDLSEGERVYSILAQCYRYENGNHSRGPERLWNFTMREYVMFSDRATLMAQRKLMMSRAQEAAEKLGFVTKLVVAHDPFFTTEAKGKAMMQKLKNLKYELVIEIDNRTCALASFNLHEKFFTEKECITIDGEICESGCMAFGLERWANAFIRVHGTDINNWPEE